MNEIGSVSIILLILILIVLIVFFIVILNLQKKKKTHVEVVTESNNKSEVEINDLLSIVSSRSSSYDDISQAVIKFINSFSFPKRDGEEVPNEAKAYLSFIFLVASHKNVNAKLIVFMNKELKKRNPKYSKEIDIYEEEGISQRKNRI